jgi:hypothetical protein
LFPFLSLSSVFSFYKVWQGFHSSTERGAEGLICRTTIVQSEFQRSRLWPLCVAQGGKKELEHLQQCTVCDPAKIFLTPKFSYLLFYQTPPSFPPKIKTKPISRWETTNSNPPGPTVQKCWGKPKSTVLSQTGIFWLFFIQF